jgi:hypothetical protein
MFATKILTILLLLQVFASYVDGNFYQLISGIILNGILIFLFAIGQLLMPKVDYKFKEINTNWTYVNDPKGEEYIAPASESVIYLSGDCDDHSILMAAAIKSIGGTPRLIHTNGHIYPEILIGKRAEMETINYLIKKVLFPQESHKKPLHYHIDERGNVWLNLDYTAKYPGGPFMKEEILSALTLD